MGEAEGDKMVRGMTDALEIRAGLASDEALKRKSENSFVSMSLSEMAREFMRVQGRDIGGMNRQQIVAEAFKRDFTETAFNNDVADFPELLSNLANKSMLRGWDEQEEVWRGFCSVGSVNDFKVNTRVGMSHYPTPAVVAENAEFLLATVTDWSETIQAATVGSRFSITRQALVNDDQSAFTVIPRRQGRAAARAVGDSVYSVLSTVVTMNEDTNPLFDAVNHLNVFAAGAPSVATVDEMRVAMRTQVDPNSGAPLQLTPTKMLVPAAYEGVASTLRNAQFDPDTAEASGNTAGNRPNWVAGTYEVYVDARIDADVTNPANWFMFANPAMNDGIEVAFLNGVETPYLEQRPGFEIDGMEYKVRLDYGVGALDWRTISLNGVAPV